MAIYLLRTQLISRGDGRSSVAAAAYRSGERLQYDGRVFDYRNKRDVLYKEIILPEHAPSEFSSRQVLWSEVEKAEDHSTRWETARVARENLLALPRELNLESQIRLTREFVIEAFVKDGMCADIAIHGGHYEADESVEANHKRLSHENPHAHVLLTTRFVTPDGFGLKNRTWDKRRTLLLWRELWDRHQNRMFMLRGFDLTVSHKSYKDRGIDREPTHHLGPELSAMERRGIHTLLGDENRAIESRNHERDERKRQREQKRERSHSRSR